MNTVPDYLVTTLSPIVAVFAVGLLARLVVPALVQQRALGLPGLDGVRVESAVRRYSFWLGWLGATDELRAGLVSGLRADLSESARDLGGRAAVHRLGSLRQAAAEAVGAQEERYRPVRWGRGLALGAVAALLVLLVELLMAAAWWDAAEASRADVAGTLPLFPGGTISWSATRGADLSWGPGYWVVFFAVVLLTAQPWRLLRRRPA